jgi:hypothetical protein
MLIGDWALDVIPKARFAIAYGHLHDNTSRTEKSASASVAADTPEAVAISYGLKAMVIRVA